VSTVPEFAYSNLSGRPPGRLVSVAGRVLRGVADVQRDVTPFGEAWQRDNVRALGETGPLWVALGDSLTQGVGAPTHDRGWVGQLRDRLRAGGTPVRVVNLGVSGAKTADVLGRQLPALELLDAALVTLMIGSNDLMRPRDRRGLVERFERILHRLPPRTVVTTLPNPSRVAGAVNAVIADVAGERDLVVAELRDPRLGSWRGRLAADHFHPNERGYQGIAEVVADSITAAGRPLIE
jgi:lysophospholipase L1-like esterase